MGSHVLPKRKHSPNFCQEPTSIFSFVKGVPNNVCEEHPSHCQKFENLQIQTLLLPFKLSKTLNFPQKNYSKPGHFPRKLTSRGTAKAWSPPRHQELWTWAKCDQLIHGVVFDGENWYKKKKHARSVRYHNHQSEKKELKKKKKQKNNDHSNNES